MKTILIVDDVQINRAYLRVLLGPSGHRLLEAGDGAQALLTIKAELPDLVIADILMPTMDGYELVRQLRLDPMIAHIPVIFWSAHYHQREALALAQSCGVAAVITKPSEPGLVLDAVEAAFASKFETEDPLSPEEFGRKHVRVLTDQLSAKVGDLKATNERLSSLIEFSLQLGTEVDLGRLIRNLAHAARQIIGAKYSIAGVLDESRTQVSSLFTSGIDVTAAAALRPPDPRAMGLSPVLGEERRLRLCNPSGDPEALGFTRSHPPIHSWLAVPIASVTKVYGYVGLIDRIGLQEFSEEDARIAGILASLVGRVYVNVSIYSNSSILDAALERRRRSFERADRNLGCSGPELADWVA